MKNLTLPFCLAIAVLCGCRSSTPSAPAAPRSDEIQIKIDSDPPGARIFFQQGAIGRNEKTDKEYIGTTPCTFPCHVRDDGTFAMQHIAVFSLVVRPFTIFTATPPYGSTNLFEKKITFRGGALLTESDHVPHALFFDLHTPQKPQTNTTN